MPDERTGPFSERFEDLVVALEAGLREHLPGFEVLDRDLDLDRAPRIALARTAGEPEAVRRADLAGVDRRGRLVLVLLVDGGDDETVLAALDALAFARDARAIAAQHWRARGASAEHEPLVVIVAESFQERCVSALSVLRADGVRLFEMRSLRAAHSSAAYLVPRPIEASGSVRAPRTTAEFSAGLAGSARALFEDLSRSLARLDDELAHDVVDDAVLWRFRGQELCCVTRSREGLEVSVGALDEAVPVADARDVDAFLDRVVRQHLRQLGAPGASTERSARAPALSRLTEPLLTPEELAAFRD